MRKYYLGYGDCPLNGGNALRTFDSEDEATEYLEDLKQEILAGTFDGEYLEGYFDGDEEPTETRLEAARVSVADDHYIYYINWSRAGAIRKADKIY
ncbi:MAG: hypothetical protein LUE27_05650 [Clostridia bacterium]|nr:hypothetical protein [Clostridia bacterium]